MTDQTVAETLNKAADHIQRYGHHRGNGFADPRSIESAACVHGALIASTLGLPHATCEAAQAVVRHHLGTFGIVAWNDAPERTAAEVIETLRAAAIIAAAQEVDVRVVAPEAEVAGAVTV